MRVLATGACGFIGSALVRHLLADPAVERVVVLDALTYAGDRDNLPWLEPGRLRVDELPPPHPGPAVVDRLDLIIGDVADPARVGPLVANTDAVLHLAAESHVDRSIAGAAPFVRTNVLGTQVVLDACLAHRVPLVHVSTDEVYGPMGPGERASEDHPFRPSSPYAASKAAADLLALAYHRTHGLDVRVVRMSNCYGPRQHPEKLLPRAACLALDGLPVPVYGDGLQSREWLHVDDACRGILAALHRGRPGRAYNLGPDGFLSDLALRELAANILGGADVQIPNVAVLHQLLGWLLPERRWTDLIEYVQDRPGHDRRYALDCGRAREELGWSPTVLLDHGLRDLAQWCRDNQDRQRARLAAAQEGT